MTNSSYYSSKVNIGNLELNTVLADMLFDGITERECDMHTHSGFEVHYVYEGSVVLEADNASCPLKPHKIYLIPPFKYHSVKDSTENLRQITLVFNLKENKNIASKNNLYSECMKLYGSVNDVRCIDINPVYFDDLFDSLINFRGDSELDREIIDAFFVFIFRKICEALSMSGENFPKQSNQSRSDRVSDVVRAKQIDDYMYDHYKLDIGIEDLAEHIHLSTRHTSRFLKNYVGKSFNDYIAGYRIELAKKLLAKGDVSAEQIAFEVGYKSYNGFSEAFRKVTGLRPKQYVEKTTEKRT